MSVIFPPASMMSAAPDAMSHSFFGERVNVASAFHLLPSPVCRRTLPSGPLSESVKDFHSPTRRLAAASQHTRADVAFASLSRAPDAARGGIHPASRPPHLLRDRIVGDAYNRFAFVGEADRHAKFRHLIYELLGAVERIDDPYAALAERSSLSTVSSEAIRNRENAWVRNRLDSAVGFGIGDGDRIIFPSSRFRNPLP